MVALYRSNRDFAGSPAFDLPAHLSSRHQQDPATLKYSEKNSETSSNSTTPSGRRKMNGARGSPQRRGRHGSGGGRGNSRAYSNSSGGSNDRPILRPMSAPLITQPSPERVLRPNMSHQAPPQVDSPVTPVKQHSSFTLNGNSINETYTARLSTHTTTPPRPIPPTQPSPRTENSRSRNSQGEQRLPQRPITKSRENNWAYEQERKVKLCNIPKGCSTKEVYQAISVYGNVVMVDIEPGTCNAYVVFRPPPTTDVSLQRIRIGPALVRSEILSPFMKTNPSPVNPRKHYYESNILPAQAIDFGTRVADSTMIVMHSTDFSIGDITMMLNLGRKELDFMFSLKVDIEVRKFRFQLPIALLSHVYKVNDSATGQPTLIIPFDSPPQFYMRKKEGDCLGNGNKHTSFSKNDRLWMEWNTWFRETDVVKDVVRRSFQGSPLMSRKDTAIIDIGRWTDYRITLDKATLAGTQFREFSDALTDYGVAIEELDQYTVRPTTPSPLWTLLEEEISGTHPNLGLTSDSKKTNFDDLFAGRVHLSFPVRYQLEACLSNGYLKEHTITKDFLEKLASQDSRRAVCVLEKVVDKQHTYYDPMEIFQVRSKNSERKVPGHFVLQRSVIITPTMMHVASPVMETSNRILRKYAADSDRFIRVKFSDEKTEGQLRTLPNDRAEAVFDRVRRAMKNGIVVAGRFYEFLAFGNSQFREHGAYFYAPTSSKSADDIRLSLGAFDHIKTVAKFGARLGQCFSTTRAMPEKVELRPIPDIVRNGYTFTDGVGKISPFLAKMAAQELELPNAFDDPPSLFQFRLGGCKGVLALDPNMKRNEVHIRPSQQKFEANFMGLEIIRSSALATPFFNRQIIVVLSNLGVPDHVIIRKQQEMVNDYETAMTDGDVAVQKLRKHIDMNQTTLTMAGMVLDGFMEAQDPFMMSLLKLWRASTIKNLKEKARIAIEDGAFVLGCVDETAILKGHMDDPQSRSNATRDEKLETLPEIFLQVDDTNAKGHYKIIEGLCVLARNPSLHPGDIRVVRAVNVPELHHLKNVVVLPQTGDRDLANMCSGGDLDGDDYMVLWDSDLTPETINVLPMDFTPEKPIEKEGPITAADISEFFVTYMKNDSLGQIAHAHLAQADFNAEGVNSHECIKLAQLHSQAVDYPKSGIPAKMERELRPKRWPHFMEKKHLQERQIYTSKKILGMLYDQVQLVDFKPQWENPFDPRILRFRAFELDDPMLKEVAEIKVSYDEALRRLMAKHGIRTEFEAWSVFVLEHNHESRDYKFSEEFGRTIAGLKAQFIGVCRAAAGMTSVTGGWNQLGPFVAAMYTVTAREMDQALKECSGGIRTMDSEHMPLISFPWLFPSELGKIATGSSVRQPIPMHQGVSHRPRKVVDTDREEPVGIVQTEAGITHYGELLNLDFGFTKSISNLAEEQRSKSYGEEQKQRSQQETETAKGTEECDRMEGGQTGLSGLRRKSSRDTAKGASS